MKRLLILAFTLLTVACLLGCDSSSVGNDLNTETNTETDSSASLDEGIKVVEKTGRYFEEIQFSGRDKSIPSEEGAYKIYTSYDEFISSGFIADENKVKEVFDNENLILSLCIDSLDYCEPWGFLKENTFESGKITFEIKNDAYCPSGLPYIGYDSTYIRNIIIPKDLLKNVQKTGKLELEAVEYGRDTIETKKTVDSNQLSLSKNKAIVFYDADAFLDFYGERKETIIFNLAYSTLRSNEEGYEEKNFIVVFLLDEYYYGGMGVEINLENEGAQIEIHACPREIEQSLTLYCVAIPYEEVENLNTEIPCSITVYKYS